MALNNYHNMGDQDAIASESISLRDWQGLYNFLYFLATEAAPLAHADDAAAARFARLEEKGLTALRAPQL